MHGRFPGQSGPARTLAAPRIAQALAAALPEFADGLLRPARLAGALGREDNACA